MVIDGTTEPVVSQELGTLQWLVLLFPRPAVAAVTGTLISQARCCHVFFCSDLGPLAVVFITSLIAAHPTFIGFCHSCTQQPPCASSTKE